MVGRLTWWHAAAVLKTWAGAIAAPTLWFVQQQYAYWRLPDPCGKASWITMVVWLLCAAGVVGASLLSARRIRAAQPNDPGEPRHLFAFGLAVIMPFLFLLPMIWQAIGGLFYSGCEQ